MLQRTLSHTVHTLKSTTRPISVTKYAMSTQSPIISVNKLKQTLQNKSKVPIGTFLTESKHTSTVQILSNSGLDYFTIDNEHGHYTTETISELSRYAILCGITPLVRVPDHQYHHIAQSLDSGAQGLMIPRITDAAQLQQLISYAKFPPTGVRGNALSRSYTLYRSGNVVDAMNTSNQQTLIIAQIETKQAIDNLDSICAVDGVDVLLIGPNDLSIALGVPGDQQCDIMQKAIQSVIDACKRTNGRVTAAIHQNNIELSQYWLDRGMGMLSVSGESGLLFNAAKNVVDTLSKK